MILVQLPADLARRNTLAGVAVAVVGRQMLGVDPAAHLAFVEAAVVIAVELVDTSLVEKRFNAANPDNDGTTEAQELKSSTGRSLARLLK